jgi:hypothetical protein
MMKNVSKPILLSLTFPLPPLDDQRTLIDALETGRAAAKGFRAEAAAIRATARVAFEKAVYAAETMDDRAIEARLRVISLSNQPLLAPWGSQFFNKGFGKLC